MSDRIQYITADDLGSRHGWRLSVQLDERGAEVIIPDSADTQIVANKLRDLARLLEEKS